MREQTARSPFKIYAAFFLTVFALALSLAADRLASSWGEELARSSTIRISAPAGQMAAQTEAALKVLTQTPGVASARLAIQGEGALQDEWTAGDMCDDSVRPDGGSSLPIGYPLHLGSDQYGPLLLSPRP